MGSSADAAMRLVREAMEGFLKPDLVSQAIFAALGEYGHEMPGTGHELDAFVRGPLSRTLLQHVDAAELRAILLSLEPILGGMMASRAPLPSPTAPPPTPEPDGFDTLEDLPTRPGAARAEPFVLVISGRDALQRRLALAVGSGLSSSTASDVVTLHAAVLALAPSVSVVDATEPPAIGAREAARAILRAPAGSLVVVWGDDRPYGREVISALGDAADGAICLSVVEGVEPLLDVVRSHGLSSRTPPSRVAVPPPGRRED